LLCEAGGYRRHVNPTVKDNTMNDKSNRPFTTNSETLVDGSVSWFVLHYDTLEKIASASDEAAVTDLEMRLNAVVIEED
jgi:hypothetical protein